MIFISYRRKDSEDFVVRLQEYLESVFGTELVFRDVDRLEGSQDWQAELERELTKSLVVLAVIGDRWELAREERVGHPHHGLLRLSLDDDAVRRELEMALSQSGMDPGQKKVIPLLINGTEMPSRERLAGLVNMSSRPDLDSIPLVKLATAGAFRLTTNSLAHEIVPLVKKIASFSDILGRKLAAWERAQGGNAGAAKGTKSRPSVVAAQHLKRTQAANAFLNLPGISKKGRVRLDIGEAYFPLIARPTGVQDHGEFRRSPEQLKGVPTLNVENIFTVGHGYRAVVVLGEPGAGKSSVASRMAWEYANACLNSNSIIGTPRVAAAKTEGGAVGPHRPVLLKLNQLDLSTLKLADRPAARGRVRDCLRRKLVRVIDPQWKGRATGSPADLLGPGPVLWIFDGLDEVLNRTHRRLVKEAIEELVKSAPDANRQHDRFLVTSRWQGYSGSVRFGEQFYEVELAPLTFDQACQFIHKWFPLAARTAHQVNPDTEAVAAAIAEAIGKANNLVRILTKLYGEHEQRKREIGPWVSAGLLHMLDNPLLTTILCLVYDEDEALPENRAELYKKAIEHMLKRKRPDAEEFQDKGVKKGRSKKAGHDAPTLRVPYHVADATAALAEVAWWLQQESQRVLGSIQALAKVAGVKLSVRNQTEIERDGAKFLECMRSEVGLLARGGGGKEAELGFIHRTFQEYLASVAAISNGKAKTLADNAGNDWWREVVALSLRSSTDFNRVFFKRFLANRIIYQNPSLSAYYLGEASELPNLAIDSYLRGQRKKGAEGAKAAVEVLQWLEGSSFKTPSLIPVLADLANDANAPVRDLAKKLQHRGAPQQAAGTKPRRTRNTKGAKLLAAPSWGASARRATGERFEDPATKLSFIWIAPGSFQMGSEAGSESERPRHPVTISHGYWLGEFPVTNEQYAVFLREAQAREPDYWDDDRFNQPQQPVVGTSWLDAMNYCAWATGKLGVRCCLPSEAQWEFACRAGQDTEYSFGGNERELQQYAWYGANSNGSTQPVGRKKPNVWGLFDMHGNVWEWCYDEYDESVYQSRAAGVIDPLNGTPSRETDGTALRVLRGGSWGDSAAICRSAIRVWFGADFAFWYSGFRVAVLPGPSVPPEQPASRGKPKLGSGRRR